MQVWEKKQKRIALTTRMLPILFAPWYYFTGENNLTGTIPHEISLLSFLEEFHVHGNQLEGEISSAISQLRRLTVLDIFNNAFTGTIHEDLYTMPNLSEMRLSENNLEGTISSQIGIMPNLINFWAANNGLSGTIPSTIGDSSSLRKFFLSECWCTDRVTTLLVHEMIPYNSVLGLVLTPSILILFVSCQNH